MAGSSNVKVALIAAGASIITGFLTLGGTLYVANRNNSSDNELISIRARQTVVVEMQPTINAQSTMIPLRDQELAQQKDTSTALEQKVNTQAATATVLAQQVTDLTSQIKRERRGYIFQEEAEQVVIEAENYSYMLPGSDYDTSRISWQVISDTIFSNRAALAAYPIVGVNTLTRLSGPALVYRIQFKNKGDYQMDVRGAAPAGPQHDSVLVSIGGEAVTSREPSGTGVGFKLEKLSWVHEDCRSTQDNGRTCVEKLPTMIHIGNPGTYNLILWLREDGVVIDKIVLGTTYSDNESVKNELRESTRIDP